MALGQVARRVDRQVLCSGQMRIIVAAFLVLAPAAVQAAGLCEKIEHADLAALDRVFSASMAFEGCIAADSADGSYACRWKFDHGKTDSRRIFEDVTNSLSGCPGHTGAVRDTPVNHPDFADAYYFAYPNRDIAVSLKDKAVLGSTFVSLRAEATD